MKNRFNKWSLGFCWVLAAVGCTSKTESGVQNAACDFQIEGRRIACDFDVSFDRTPSRTQCRVKGPIILGIAPKGGDPAWGGLVSDAADGHAEPFKTEFEPLGVYLISGADQMKQIGRLHSPLMVNIEGEHSARACGWLLAESLFVEKDSTLGPALKLAISELGKTATQQ